MANVPPGFPPGGYSPTGSGAPPPAPPGAAPGYRGPMAPPAYGPQGGQGGGGYGPPPAQPGGPAAPPPGYPHAPARPGYAPAYAQPGVQQGGRGQPGVAPGAYPPMGAAPGYGAPGGPAGYGPPGVPPGYGQPGAGPGYPGPAMAPAGPPKTAGGAVDTLKRFGLGPSRLLGLGVGVVALLGVAGYGYWSYSHPTIRFVNASTSPALQVYLDGKPVAADSQAVDLGARSRSEFEVGERRDGQPQARGQGRLWGRRGRAIGDDRGRRRLSVCASAFEQSVLDPADRWVRYGSCCQSHAASGASAVVLAAASSARLLVQRHAEHRSGESKDGQRQHQGRAAAARLRGSKLRALSRAACGRRICAQSLSLMKGPLREAANAPWTQRAGARMGSSAYALELICDRAHRRRWRSRRARRS